MAGDGTQQGEIQILHATPEQISQLQQAQHIQILSGDQVIGVSADYVSNRCTNTNGSISDSLTAKVWNHYTFGLIFFFCAEVFHLRLCYSLFVCMFFICF